MIETDGVTADQPQETATPESSVPFWEQMDQPSTEETPAPTAEEEASSQEPEAEHAETEAEPEADEDADYLPD